MVDAENKKQVGTMHYLSASPISIFTKYTTSADSSPKIRPIKPATSNVSLTKVN